jgi:hypothetical protein
MPDIIEEAKTAAYALDTRSVYSRIGKKKIFAFFFLMFVHFLALIYDTSLDMIEYRLSYLRLAKQHIIYKAQVPRVSLLYELRSRAKEIVSDLMKLHVDLIFCVMSTERELQFVRLIKDYNSISVTHVLLNQTSWWFVSRLGEIRNLTYFPKIYTASEDRRRLLSQFSSLSAKILLNAVLRTYIRLPISSLFIGSTNCGSQQNIYQLRKTHMFIK